MDNSIEVMEALNTIIALLKNMQPEPLEQLETGDDPGLYLSVMAHGSTPEETAQIVREAFLNHIG